MEAGAKVAGSRFAYLKGDLVFLELALVRWVLEKLRGHGFEAVIPPVLVREEALFGTGFLPRHRAADLPACRRRAVSLGHIEVALASLHAGEIMDQVPRRYAGFSPCFRREAGAAGRDTRGIFRVHQFDKVEMFSFVEPDASAAEHERLLAIEEEILQALEIPYRVVNIAVDDLGARRPRSTTRGLAARPGALPRADLDLEHDRLPGAPARHPLPAGGGKPAHVHTLNGTAVAWDGR
jgi:seryl-tRNA synthetase